MGEHKANMLTCSDGRGPQRRASDFGWNPSSAASEHRRRFVRWATGLREWITSRSLTQSGMEHLALRHRLVEQIVRYRRVRKRLRELGAIRSAARGEKIFPLFSQLREPHRSATSSSPNLDEALQRLQQITGDGVLRMEIARCADRSSSAPGSHCLKV